MTTTKRSNMSKAIFCAALTVLMLLSLTGCKSKTTKYKENLSQVVTEISEMNTDVTAAVTALSTALESKDSASYGAALQTLTEYSNTLKGKYQQLASGEVPEQFQEQAAELKTHGDNLCKMLDDSIELYTIAGTALTAELTQEQIERITQLETEIKELSTSADSFDAILSEILNSK